MLCFQRRRRTRRPPCIMSSEPSSTEPWESSCRHRSEFISLESRRLIFLSPHAIAQAFQSESSRLILSVSFILPLNVSFPPTSSLSRQLFISFKIACLNSHLPPFYFSLLLSLLRHNAARTPIPLRPLPPYPTNRLKETEKKTKKTKKVRLPWVLSTLFRVAVPAALRWHFRICASP